MVLPGCGFAPASGQSKSPPENLEGAPRTVRAVQTAAVPRERIITAIGTLGALDQATLSTKVAGRLQSITVDLGSEVRPGDLLARIEPADYELRVRQAEALLAQARVRIGLELDGQEDTIDPEQSSTVRQKKAILEESRAHRERIRELAVLGIISLSEVETSEAAFEVALSSYEDSLEEARTRQALVRQRRAEVDIARQQLEDTAIYAPFEGTVQARRAQAGEYLAAGTPVATLVRMNPLRLRLEVSEADAPHIRVGQAVRLQVEGTAQNYTAVLKRLSPVIDERSRMLRVEADVENPGTLRAGSFVRAEIVIDSAETGILLPRNALVTFAGIEKVWVVREGRAVEQPVVTGRKQVDSVEVLSGLAAGEWVVLDAGSLRAGDAVSVLN